MNYFVTNVRCSTDGFAAMRNGSSLGWGDFILLNGVSSILAQLQSTTAISDVSIFSLSRGLTQLTPTGVRTKPWNLWPSFRFFKEKKVKHFCNWLAILTRLTFISPCLKSFRPEHFFGSQWFKSHMATEKLAAVPFSFSSSSPSLPEPEVGSLISTESSPKFSARPRWFDRFHQQIFTIELEDD